MKHKNPTTTGVCAVKTITNNGSSVPYKHPTPQAFTQIQPFSRTCGTIGDRLRLAISQQRLTDAIALIEAAGYSKDSVIFVLQAGV